ncbi:MAG: hypothetical protein RJB09_668 [Pseudomonadota bacterium]
MNKAAVMLGLGILIALPLSGCGRRGQLESPDAREAAASPKATQSGRYSLGAQTADNDEDETPVTAPKRPFILDSIL